jgi:hypothetical protein
VQPLILPREGSAQNELAVGGGQLAVKTNTKRQKKSERPLDGVKRKALNSLSSRGLRFDAPVAQVSTKIVAKPKPVRAPKAKADPRLISAARELRDRWLERINDTPILPSAKYEACRQISQTREMPLLAA